MGNDFSFLIFGIYIIAVSWVVHGWILPAFAIYITAEIALAYSAAVFSSASLAEQLISAVTGAIIVFGLGFWLRAEHAKNTRYAEEAQKAHEEAAAASAHVRRELATLLHDTVAKDLVRITLSAQNLADKHTDLQSELQDLAEIASQASQRVRPVILDMRQPPAASAHLASTIELAQRMLNTREITLEVEMPDNLDSELSDQQKALLRLLISEGVTNILKYAPVGACASMLISVGEQSAVSATLSNPIADNPEPSIIGGFGLQNLEFHFKESGGMVQYMRFKNRWLLYGEIPAQEER
ncbi:two-component system sensor histidine kinase UhpB [Arcanobacterium hippocoleae]|uniref:histidine kinase n=1 Tax=Arcanobacterium hippocoleae TaxID=149017 RepID=A0ABU1T267_9ACTO|nr:two-component system sensor histidine kinase UhpB [Arcanobacterium hippocoleae]